MKIPNDTVRNGTRNVPVCSAVPLQTAPPRVWKQKAVYLNTELDGSSETSELIYQTKQHQFSDDDTVHSQRHKTAKSHRKKPAFT
jgi:hypothetical protein